MWLSLAHASALGKLPAHAEFHPCLSCYLVSPAFIPSSHAELKVRLKRKDFFFKGNEQAWGRLASGQRRRAGVSKAAVAQAADTAVCSSQS